ncbi:MAG: DUF3794 domain-containing protein [bacterium]|nr:DUF3794 domain-containing protein [bacterium]
MNITKSPISVSEIVYRQNIEHSIDTDFTLPDYCPDISRVLKCRIKPRIISKAFNSSQITIDGNVSFNLIYADEENKICNYEWVFPFSKTIDIGKNIEVCSAQLNVRTEYMNCRAVTPRKMDIHGALSISVCLTGKKVAEVISDIQREDINKKCSVVNFTNPLNFAEKYIIIEEEIALAQAGDSYLNILRYDTIAIANDCKIVGGKAVIKGELIINALYSTESNGGTECIKNTIPFSQIVDIDGIGDECDCEVKIDVTYAELKQNSNSGEGASSIAVDAKLHMVVSAYCKSEVPVVFDVFSTDYDLDVKREEVVFERLISKINERFICNKNVDVREIPISSVVDLWCESNLTSVRNTDNQMVINGTVIICVLAYDMDMMPVYFEKPVDYEYTNILNECPTMLRCDPDVDVISVNYLLNDNHSVDVKVELSIGTVVFDVNKTTVLTDVTVNEDSPKKKNNDIAVYVYYANRGEEVWDIARRYNTSPEAIILANEDTNEILESDKMLLIPCK